MVDLETFLGLAMPNKSCLDVTKQTSFVVTFKKFQSLYTILYEYAQVGIVEMCVCACVCAFVCIKDLIFKYSHSLEMVHERKFRVCKSHFLNSQQYKITVQFIAKVTLRAHVLIDSNVSNSSNLT